jgi:hypothetical protein
MGCELHHPNPASGNKRGYYGDTQSAYLERVYLHDIANEHLYAEGAGDAVYHRKLNWNGTTGGSGDVTPY